MDESQKRRVSKTSRGESTFSPSHPNRPDYLRKAAVDQPEEFTLLPISLCSKHHLCNHRFAPVASRLSFSLSSVPSSPSSSLHHRSSHHNRHIRLPPYSSSLQRTKQTHQITSDRPRPHIMPKRAIPAAAVAPITALRPPPPPSLLIQRLRTDWRWAAISQFLWMFSDAFGFVDWDIEVGCPPFLPSLSSLLVIPDNRTGCHMHLRHPVILKKYLC